MPKSEGDLGWAWVGAKCLRLVGSAAQPDKSRLNFYAPPFVTGTTQDFWFFGEAEAVPRREPLPKLMRRSQSEFPEFASLHGEILRGIAAGEFQKLVPIVHESLSFEHDLSASMFAPKGPALENQFAGFEFRGEGMVGTTPEVLFSVKNGVLETMALAGTGPLHGPSLFDSAKEMREHELVVEDVSQTLARFGAVDVGRTEERKLAILKHLHTSVRVKLERPPDFESFVTALHPTAALGGWPRATALAWHGSRDGALRRRRFGAPFGFVDSDEMLCLVAIRNIQWQGREARIFTGCGVVEGSRAEAEWDELMLKRESVHRNLELSL